MGLSAAWNVATTSLAANASQTAVVSRNISGAQNTSGYVSAKVANLVTTASGAVVQSVTNLTNATLFHSRDVVSKYVMQNLETNQGAQNPGVQLALYFQQNASKISNGYSILADKSLLTVVQTTLGISSYTSTENIDTQKAQFDKLLTYSDFHNPAKLQSFLQRFAAQYDYNNPTAGSSNTTNLLSLASGQTSGFSVDLLMSLQGLKLGGS